MSAMAVFRGAVSVGQRSGEHVSYILVTSKLTVCGLMVALLMILKVIHHLYCKYV